MDAEGCRQGQSGRLSAVKQEDAPEGGQLPAGDAPAPIVPPKQEADDDEKQMISYVIFSFLKKGKCHFSYSYNTNMKVIKNLVKLQRRRGEMVN